MRRLLLLALIPMLGLLTFPTTDAVAVMFRAGGRLGADADRGDGAIGGGGAAGRRLGLPREDEPRNAHERLRALLDRDPGGARDGRLGDAERATDRLQAAEPADPARARA